MNIRCRITPYARYASHDTSYPMLQGGLTAHHLYESYPIPSHVIGYLLFHTTGITPRALHFGFSLAYPGLTQPQSFITLTHCYSRIKKMYTSTPYYLNWLITCSVKFLRTHRHANARRLTTPSMSYVTHMSSKDASSLHGFIQSPRYPN